MENLLLLHVGQAVFSVWGAEMAVRCSRAFDIKIPLVRSLRLVRSTISGQAHWFAASLLLSLPQMAAFALSYPSLGEERKDGHSHPA